MEEAFPMMYIVTAQCFSFRSTVTLGILYKADPDPNSDLQKNRTPDL